MLRQEGFLGRFRLSRYCDKVWKHPRFLEVSSFLKLQGCRFLQDFWVNKDQFASVIYIDKVSTSKQGCSFSIVFKSPRLLDYAKVLFAVKSFYWKVIENLF